MTEMPDDVVLAQQMKDCRDRIVRELRKLIVGQDDVVEQVLISLFVGGNSIITGVPGLAKTLIVHTLAQVLDLKFSRIQFTPDLMPSDITGTDIIQEDPATGRRQLVFVPGPIFSHIVLADEINRTPPKTQSALLEAMQEHRVTVQGKTYVLDEPFFVFATQNPIELEGTYPLPEAQLDRFTIRLELRYLTEHDEASMLRRRLDRGSADPTVGRVVDAHELLAMRESVEQVTVHEYVLQYVVSLAVASRQHPQVAVGASPRAELDLVQLARARALLVGRDYVIPEDVKALAVPAMAHRISLRPEMWVRQVRTSDVVEELLRRLPVPRTRGAT
jgi:MoxR-like ATPase